ncbi:hypothetical protein J0X14_07705 [Muricauda sp. CAU 1633]|uniref:hypothetical protein n=1 Tax=Allomuricauda sp. CAU 1633 TaxID=2816036 RepID=UPI001A8E4679|nr:hypothetical protein [Muricauda sp. CAU 1633]MBO0322176.1 hypothetical protein [Muricauda sp. CAU 1633]
MTKATTNKFSIKKFLREKVLLKWTAIERIGNSKIAKQSYIWFFIIPMLAKLLENVPPEISFDLISMEPIPINLEFPFRWYVLFAVGLLFILANMIYMASCPHIVKEFRNYSQFNESGYPTLYLVEQGKLNKMDQNETEQLLKLYKDSQTDPRFVSFQKEAYLNKQKEYFDEVYIRANASLPWVRLLGTFVIYAAAVLILNLFLENILAVYEMAAK